MYSGTPRLLTTKGTGGGATRLCQRLPAPGPLSNINGKSAYRKYVLQNDNIFDL